MHKIKQLQRQVSDADAQPLIAVVPDLHRHVIAVGVLLPGRYAQPLVQFPVVVLVLTVIQRPVPVGVLRVACLPVDHRRPDVPRPVLRVVVEDQLDVLGHRAHHAAAAQQARRGRRQFRAIELVQSPVQRRQNLGGRRRLAHREAKVHVLDRKARQRRVRRPVRLAEVRRPRPHEYVDPRAADHRRRHIPARDPPVVARYAHAGHRLDRRLQRRERRLERRRVADVLRDPRAKGHQLLRSLLVEQAPVHMHKIKQLQRQVSDAQPQPLIAVEPDFNGGTGPRQTSGGDGQALVELTVAVLVLAAVEHSVVVGVLSVGRHPIDDGRPQAARPGPIVVVQNQLDVLRRLTDDIAAAQETGLRRLQLGGVKLIQAAICQLKQGFRQRGVHDRHAEINA